MIAEILAAASAGLILHHHIAYPLLLRVAAGRPFAASGGDGVTPPVGTMAVIVPAYNEETHIAAKIRNCAALDFPRGAVKFVIACDGCVDETVARAREALAGLGAAGEKFELAAFDDNRGKVAVLNEAIAARTEDFIALSDVSAMLAPDALLRAAEALADPGVGFVTGLYTLPRGDAAAQAYWRYQSRIKCGEAAFGAPIGAHGAFYAFPRRRWTPLPADTINDDVMLPMRIVAAGARGIYESRIVIAERQRDSRGDDFRRRMRLGAGALQQMIRLGRLADPRRPGVAFCFLSGKGLRAVMPFIIAIFLLSSLGVAAHHGWGAAGLAVLALGAALVALHAVAPRRLGALAAPCYVAAGYLAAGIGALGYVCGQWRGPWTRAASFGPEDDAYDVLKGRAALGKRALDIVVASLMLIPLAALLPFIALAIKLESPGPVFYRQLRVGLRTPRYSRLIYITKFRSMRCDAEARTGAVWASQGDPRVTRIGRFLRKSRLDELPQCLDVLRGDLSVVGPRPERPEFFMRLEHEIPFFSERTYGVKPGITGLAQVALPYPGTVDEVREKVLHDHAYALRLAAPGRWLATDLGVMWRTVAVMALGRGR